MAATNGADDGSQPINFRAALAAFEQNSVPANVSTTSYHSPKPRAAQPASHRPPPPPRTPARPSSGHDPVPRSSSTPRIRNNSDGLMPPSVNTASSPILAPTTSASGMLSAPSPTFSTLRKTGSGTSLNELMSKTLPRSTGASRNVSPFSRARSRSITGNENNTSAANSAPGSGRSSPYLAARATLHGLFGQDPQRTESPASTSQHMLDTSADDDMFAHAVMERSSTPASIRSTASSLAPPPQVPSRKGSASSTNSANAGSSTPRLPPRPAAGGGGGGSLQPSPTISEFGQLPAVPSVASTPKAANGKTGVTYATYTPGAKRGSGNSGVEGGMTPPALPPRSATLGQAERATGTPYKARQASPMKRTPPCVPAKPSGAFRPPPPPRPAKALDGAAGGFRFGAAHESTQPPVARVGGPRTVPRHQRSLTGGGGSSSSSGLSASASAHRKTGSNVFTSISLSDDASGELKRSLESDLHADHASQPPPPTRGRLASSTGAGYPTHSTTRGSSTGSASAAGGVVSSLIGTAASAIPLFKSGATASRSLADGAPSKQYGSAMVSRSASAGSGLTAAAAGAVDGEAAMWGRAVQLADAASVVGNPVQRGRLKEPQDQAARTRYEELFDSLLSQQCVTKGNAEVAEAPTAETRGMERSASGTGGGVQALRGWFESDPSTAAITHPTAPTTPTPPAPPSSSDSGRPSDAAPISGLSASTVRAIWTRSRLPHAWLAQLWDLASPSPSRHGMGKAAFVRAMATIDAELERKRQRRQTRQQKRSATSGAGRRVPPPPPPGASTAV